MKYGSEYLSWKKWNGLFGKISLSDSIYFKSELKRSKLYNLPDLNIFEIGFGNGYFLEFCRLSNINISGSEINQNLLDLAKEKKFSTLHASNMNTLQDSTFDGIVCFDVIEHLTHEEILALFSECIRISKNGGKILLRFPNGDSPLGLSNQNGDVTHINSIGVGKIKFYSSLLNMSIEYLGPPSQPLSVYIPIISFRRLMIMPIKYLLNLLVNLIFYPKEKIYFSSTNLFVIYKINKIT
jgi:SAM-dependent methyltransferase